MKPVRYSFECNVDGIYRFRIVNKFCFSHHGLGLYMCTPSELQKFTVSTETAKQMTESLGELFVPMDNPEPPKASFLKGVSTLFGGGSREQVDLDDLCKFHIFRFK